jgi:hypothetical protein
VLDPGDPPVELVSRPAQDFHVLAKERAWFSLEQDDHDSVLAFRWEDLRRLPEAAVTRP